MFGKLKTRGKFSSRKEKKKTNLLKILIGVTFLGIIVVAFFLVTPTIFNIKKVDILSDKIDCVSEGEIKKQADLINKNILFFDRNAIRHNLIKKFSCIKSVEFQISQFNTLKVNLLGREAVLAFVKAPLQEASISAVLNDLQISKNSTSSASASSSGILAQFRDEYFLTDDSGFIFSLVLKSPTISVVEYWDNSLKVGSSINNQNFLKLLAIIQKLKEIELVISGVKVYSTNTVLVMSSQPILFSLDTDVENQLAALQLILQKAKIDDENMFFIDLRFDKPIVKFVPKKK